MCRFASSSFRLICLTVKRGGSPVCQECPKYSGPGGWPRIPAWGPRPWAEFLPHEWPSICSCPESHPCWPAHFWKETFPAPSLLPRHPFPSARGALLLAQKHAMISPFVKRIACGPHGQYRYPCLCSCLCSLQFLFCAHLHLGRAGHEPTIPLALKALSV